MNALVKKEIRLLLPSFVICCALALPNLAFRFNSDGSLISWWWFVLAFIFCGAMAAMLALNSFGAEIGSGTFSNLLAQPISRQKIWDTKISLLAVSLFIVAVCWSGCGLLRLKMLGRDLNLLDLFAGVGTFGLVVFSGGLWTVLLLRQVAAAFWFTVLVPGVMLVIIAGLLADQSDAFVEGVIVSVLGLYSLAGFFFARWLFLRAQDVAWTGGTIAMPEMRGTSKMFARRAEKRCWRPRAALFWKELQLHQAQFIMAGALALLHLGVIATRKFGHYQKDSSTEFILEIFWGLWLVMPLLVGAAAVAEERKLDTLGSQFGLPVKRHTQFAVKFRVAILLSLLFGAVMPLLLEGVRILPNVGILPSGFHFESGYLGMLNGWQFLFWYGLETANQLTPLLALSGLAIAIGAISFYASTLARNTLQALAPAVLGLTLTFFLNVVLIQPDNFGLHLPWQGWLVYFIGIPVLATTLVGLSFRNFQRLKPGWLAWVRNVFAFAAVLLLVFAMTTAIYHRAWEKFSPFEPAHGAARLTRANPPTLTGQWNSFSVRLSDGRIWADDTAFFTFMANPLALFLGDIRLANPDGGHYYDGSNWVKVILSYRNERVGIKTDGSLWISETPARSEHLAQGGWKVTAAGNLVRFGSETNWSSVIPHGSDMLLVKHDGTLWHWGVLTNWNWKTEWPGLRAFMPQRLGTESNWAEVFLAGYQPILRKTDGSIWTTSNDDGATNRTTIQLARNFSLERAVYLENGNWRSTTRINIGSVVQVGIRDDGTFRISADQQLEKYSYHDFPTYHFEWTAVDLHLGQDTNWLAVAGSQRPIVTLKDDGTLWLWNFYHDYRRGWDSKRDEREMLAVKPVRLGTHADWIAITSAGGGIISLAADGSLWYWPLASAGEIVSDYGRGGLWDNTGGNNIEPLLDISRKPQPLGNIFGKAD